MRKNLTNKTKSKNSSLNFAMLKEKRGITLVALVVTIVVLLILAGVSLNLLIGNNGIITRARQAKISNDLSSYKEQLAMFIAEKKVENPEFYVLLFFLGSSTLQNCFLSCFVHIEMRYFDISYKSLRIHLCRFFYVGAYQRRSWYQKLSYIYRQIQNHLYSIF